MLAPSRTMVTMSTSEPQPLVSCSPAASRHFATSPHTPTPAGQKFLQGLPESTPFNGKFPKEVGFFYLNHFFPLEGDNLEEIAKTLPRTLVGGLLLSSPKGYPTDVPASERDNYLWCDESGSIVPQRASRIKVNLIGGKTEAAIILVYPVDPVSRTRKITCEVLDDSITATSTEFTQNYANAHQMALKESGALFFSSALGETDSLHAPISEEAALYYVDLFKPLEGETLILKQQAAERLYSIPLSRVSHCLVSKEDSSETRVNVICVEALVNGQPTRLAEITVYPVSGHRTRKITCVPLHPSFATEGREATHLYGEHMQANPDFQPRERTGLGAFVMEYCQDSVNSAQIVYAYAYTKDGKGVRTKVGRDRKECNALPRTIIDDIFKNGCAGHVFYAHDFARIGAFTLVQEAAFYKSKGRIANIVYHEDANAVLSLEIGPPAEGKKGKQGDERLQTILFRDSARIASGSLEKLAESFKLSSPLSFPDKFVRPETLSYVGAAPGEEF